mmetsp:Transcript_12014/g.23941  ORF Transcript_12014/g.23941 Transcript_12014/m.23941 type:complete len:460 (-) Transcript_12014:111-1490(-)
MRYPVRALRVFILFSLAPSGAGSEDGICDSAGSPASCGKKEKPKHSYTYPEFRPASSIFPVRDMGNCDPDLTFLKGCKPRASSCTEEVVDHFSHHGIGNALVISYTKRAEPVFDKGCLPKLTDENTKNVARYGSVEDASFFQLLRHVKVLEFIVSGSDKKCSIYALTQPRKEPREVVDGLRGRWRDASDAIVAQQGAAPRPPRADGRPPVPARPLLGIHVRTGWADEVNRREAQWDALGDCTEYRDQYFGDGGRLGPAGTGVRDGRDNFSLRPFVADALAASDAAFGEDNYVVFVASDAPAVKYYVKDYVASTGSNVETIFHEMKLGHNAGQQSNHIKSMDHNLEVQRSTIVDLIMLSEATLLANISSKFPDAAHTRNQCGQRRVDVWGHLRHRLSDAGGLLEKALAHRGGEEDWVPDIDAQGMDKLATVLPHGKQHQCFDDAAPSRSCMCFLKLAHVV